MFDANYFLWSVQDNFVISNQALGFHRFHDVSSNEGSFYQKERAEYEHKRGYQWSLKAKSSTKLLELLKEYENLVSKTSIIVCEWKSQYEAQLLLGDGHLIRFVLSTETDTLERIFIDKSIVGKLSNSQVHSGQFCEGLILSCHDSSPVINVISYSQPTHQRKSSLSQKLSIPQPEKLNSLNMKINSIDLPLTASQHCRKHFCVNQRNDYIIVWWSVSLWPTGKSDNIYLYTIKSSKLEFVKSTRTESPIQNILFRRNNSDEFVVLESFNDFMPGDSRVILDISTYHIKKNEIQKMGQQSLSVSNCIEWSDLHPSMDILLLVLRGGTLLRHDFTFSQSNEFNLRMNIAACTWHKEGNVVFIWSQEGEIRICNFICQAISFNLQESFVSQPKTDYNLCKYFRHNKKLVSAIWCNHSMPGCPVTKLLLLHDNGPLGCLNLNTSSGDAGLSISRNLQYFCHNNELNKAVELMRAMHWPADPEMCYTCLSLVVNALFVLQLDKNIIGLIEDCLGSFYVSRCQIPDHVIQQYKEPMMQLTRRFFFHLLHNGFLEKSFLLAEDIGHTDLFMDLYHEAKKVGDLVLAEVSKLKAEALENPQSDSSSDSGSDCENFLSALPSNALNPADERGDNFAFEDRLTNQFAQMLTMPTKSTISTFSDHKNDPCDE